VVPRDGPEKGKWPEFDFVIVSVDSAYTEKEENNPTGCTDRQEQRKAAATADIVAGRARTPMHSLQSVLSVVAVECSVLR
jgi:hypothetical protein